jgi:hypothetical protein
MRTKKGIEPQEWSIKKEEEEEEEATVCRYEKRDTKEPSE